MTDPAAFDPAELDSGIHDVEGVYDEVTVPAHVLEGLATAERATVRHGEPSGDPYWSEQIFDACALIAPRRHELLDADTARLWFIDLHAWVEWATTTFRLTRWFPPCWMQHPALVEEATALWAHWQEVWLGGSSGQAAGDWLRVLDAALARIENRWQIPCTREAHKDPTPLPESERREPDPEPWWSRADFDAPGFTYN